MAYILASRLVSRRLLGIQTKIPIFGIGSRAAAAAKGTPPCVQQITLRKGETHDEKNARLKRPLSPCLSVYRPQVTSMLSITHRVTGVIVSVYFMALAACAVWLPYNFTELADIIECLELPQPVVWLGRLVLGFPFVYHMCNGVRHLLWDTGTGFTMSAVFQTGMAMLTMCLIGTIIVVFAL